MRNILLLFSLLFFSSGTVSFELVEYQSSPCVIGADDAYFPDRLYVVFKPDVEKFWSNEFILSPEIFPEFRKFKDEFKIEKIQNSFYFVKKDEFLQRAFTLYLSECDKIDELIWLLSQEPRIRLAEKKPIMRKTLVPNDDQYGSQWHLHHINAEQAWDIETGSGMIDVGVVDDAIEVNHPDLAPSIQGGWDISNNDSDPSPPNDDYAHGTHVAGIVSAKSNNGDGVASIGFGGVDIIPVKASDGTTDEYGRALITDGYGGIAWAAEGAGAEIINCSWGGANSGTEEHIINLYYDEGVIIVASAGNENTDEPKYPAAYQNVISVASSSNTNDDKSSFSNFGQHINITAPGSSIRSTIINGSYGYNQGTSMAAPLVAGLMGLVWSANPSQSRDNVVSCVMQTTVPLTWDGGAGRIDAQAAMQCASVSSVWTDYNWSGNENGSFHQPYNTLAEAVSAVPNGGTIFIKSSSQNEVININTNKNFSIHSWNGTAVVGQ